MSLAVIACRISIGIASRGAKVYDAYAAILGSMTVVFECTRATIPHSSCAVLRRGKVAASLNNERIGRDHDGLSTATSNATELWCIQCDDALRDDIISDSLLRRSASAHGNPNAADDGE